MNEKFVKNGEVEIQYIVENYSPAETPVIIIPGAIVGAEDIYNDIKDYLDFYCIIISIRGRGKSSIPKTGYTKEAQVSDIESVVRREAIDEFYIAGHSYGASLAYAYSIKYPEKIKALVGLDFPVILPSYSEQWADYIRNNVSDVNEDFLSGIVKESSYESFEDDLSLLHFKKLFIKGSGSDSLLKQETAEKIIGKIPNSELKIINGAGHELFAEKPNETLTIIKNFVSV